jgi:dipeptidyl aminopeptidase/acylaminoacyl peptidase
MKIPYPRIRLRAINSQRAVDDLQRKNIPSKLIYFPDEGHWVLKPQNSRLWYGQVLDWFDQWLKR